jgi:hypothetical protein
MGVRGFGLCKGPTPHPNPSPLEGEGRDGRQSGEKHAMRKARRSDKAAQGGSAAALYGRESTEEEDATQSEVVNFSHLIIKFGWEQEVWQEKGLVANEGKRFALTRFIRWL